MILKEVSESLKASQSFHYLCVACCEEKDVAAFWENKKIPVISVGKVGNTAVFVFKRRLNKREIRYIHYLM